MRITRTLKVLDIFLLLAVLLSACSGGGGATLTPTSLPTPRISVTSAPDAPSAAQAFLDAWKAADYATMYNLLTVVGRGAVTQEDFTKRFTDAAIALTQQSVNFEILSHITNTSSAQVAYRVTYTTAIFNDISRDTIMNLTLEDNNWRVQWDDTLILPELVNGNHLALDYSIPTRGTIKDRSGATVASQADAYALGIIPGQIEDGQEKRLLNILSDLTNRTPESIKALYENAGDNWYIGVGEAPASEVDAQMDTLSEMGGIVLRSFSARYYPDGGVGPHAVGYVQAIPAESVDQYRLQGYSGSEMVGMTGLEKYAEKELSGTRGASLYVVDVNGAIVTRLQQVETLPANTVVTTIDRQLQVQVQKAIEGFEGAVVVLERDTGRVLAMVSSPGFDPNLFETENYNSGWLLGSMVGDPQNPLLNRAAQSSFPLGSVFKIITMAAALESGVYTEETTYDCQYEFTELPGDPLYDWTYTHDVAPSGMLTLPEGLMRSCNPYFYSIGLKLFREKGATAVSDMARGFGLGSPTGIGQLAEDAGNMPDPASDTEAVQLAIGQGTMLVTPLQVARFVAAVGNGGTLYRPQMIEEIIGPGDKATFTFSPEAQGTLPLSKENLKIIQDAMYSVANNPRGTAYRILANVGVTIYGKTGTAQNPGDQPHAWFAGYTDEGNEDKPDIAVVVLALNAGEGSDIAAPIFRRVVEDYFYGKPNALYKWETKLYVTITPTERYTRTPTETAVPTETPTATPTLEPTFTPTP